MFTRTLKFVGLIWLCSLGLILWPQASLALDRLYPYYTNNELYGDLNVEFRLQGGGGGSRSTETDYSLIHYYRLGLRSYIWDPRLLTYSVEGNFYQDLTLSDSSAPDYYRYGGFAAVTLFPRSALSATVIYGKEFSSNPGLTNTYYEFNSLLFTPAWPVIGVFLRSDNYFSDDKNFKEDKDYTHGQLHFNYVYYFKARRTAKRADDEENGNGNGNGGNGKGKNGNGKPTEPGTLHISAFYDYLRVDDNLTHQSTDQHQTRIAWDYYFNNYQSHVINTYAWDRINNNDTYRVSLDYYTQTPTQLSYNLGGRFQYANDNLNGVSSYDGMVVAGLNKIFSPQWAGNLGVAGEYSQNSSGGSSWGGGGGGGIFSRMFRDLDWAVNVGGNYKNSQSDTGNTNNSNYGFNLTALYRLAPEKLLSGEYFLSFVTDESQNQTLDNRARLTLDTSWWSSRFTLRNIVDFRYQTNNGSQGNIMTISSDNYGFYRLTPQTSLSAGVNFIYTSDNVVNDEILRAYISLRSNPWRNLSYGLTGYLDYDLKKAQWTARAESEIYYRWRQLYFSVTGQFSYGSGDRAASGWNYYVIFRVSRPFSIVF